VVVALTDKGGVTALIGQCVIKHADATGRVGYGVDCLMENQDPKAAQIATKQGATSNEFARARCTDQLAQQYPGLATHAGVVAGD
jgi:hypothetical protein